MKMLSSVEQADMALPMRRTALADGDSSVLYTSYTCVKFSNGTIKTQVYDGAVSIARATATVARRFTSPASLISLTAIT